MWHTCVCPISAKKKNKTKKGEEYRSFKFTQEGHESQASRAEGQEKEVPIGTKNSGENWDWLKLEGRYSLPDGTKIMRTSGDM